MKVNKKVITNHCRCNVKNCFMEIKSYFHIALNSDLIEADMSKYDKLFKIRHL